MSQRRKQGFEFKQAQCKCFIKKVNLNIYLFYSILSLVTLFVYKSLKIGLSIGIRKPITRIILNTMIKHNNSLDLINIKSHNGSISGILRIDISLKEFDFITHKRYFFGMYQKMR